ncbi:MAG: hypothetical protein MR591_04225 [Helicobacter sp.]|uniref:hypothetical protein n=1 Tax=Helicobacter sp. TaxID=218 RepID=UPI002A7CE635|nr:hypothetical protein [Helicobacter sp.]MDY2823958.1 hypothetical protein [Helicobacter sp.]
MRYLIGFVCSLSFVFAIQAQKIDIHTGKESNEVLLYLDTPYDSTPQITTKNEYKGVIFTNITAQAQNKHISGSLVSEIQIFNINNDLYVLGVGDPTQIDVEVSKAGQTFKVTFLKAKPSHLELLMNKSLNIPTTQGDSEISQNIATLPKPNDANFASTTQSHQISLQDNTKQSQQNPNEKDSTQTLKLGKNGDLDPWRYGALVGIMVLLLVILLWTRNTLRKSTQPFSSYLDPKSTKNTHFELNPFDPTIKIIAQKRVDSKNKILTLETNGYRYVVLMGNSNTLLDRYPIAKHNESPKPTLYDNLVIEDSQFSNLLEQKAQRLRQLKNDQNI